MFKLFTVFFLVLFTQQCNDIPSKQHSVTDSIAPVPLAVLPNKLNESSGLEVVDGKIYSINDSGGKAELFVFDSLGNSQGRIKIQHAKNHDWESIAANATHFLIGDFGNNSGNRENLLIYHFPLSDLTHDKIKADKIKFSYANQSHYNHQKKKHSFDGEAMIALDSSLVIFSKDWLHQKTQAYHIPLELDDKTLLIEPSEELAINALITGADYDRKSKKLVLSGYVNNHNYIWLFQNSTPQKLLTANYKKYELQGLHGAQVEGIAFKNSNQILISTEKTKKFQPQMWKVNVPY